MTTIPAGDVATPPVQINSGGEPVESWLAAVAAAPAIALGPEIGEVIAGEFRIEQRLGEGGMGVVYLAQHLVLDRKVAIKLHRAATRNAAERLLREARAAAKVEHENVLVVYEVGTWNEHVFVAMEYVDGWTARQWVDAAPRTWREIVPLYLEAGRGLAAAHARGLVHRDFKPDNVLVGRGNSAGRGRVRVADFGLARSATEPAPADADTADLSTAPAQIGVTDGIAGSPAYMAPEQYIRGNVDARADQFAFCVALFEALFGRRPFAGADLGQLAWAIASGDVQEPTGASVPAHVRRVLRRGLSAEASARYPDMPALLRELGGDPIAARRRRVGLALVIGATGLVTWGVTRQPDPMQGCTDAPAVASWWTPDTAATLRTALRASGRSFADDSFDRIDTELGIRRDAAAAALAAACHATHVEGTRSLVQLQGQRECLAQRGREIGALLDVLGRGEPEIVDRAVFAVQGLTPIARCDAPTGDGDLHDIDASERPQIDAALELIALLAELGATGRYEEVVSVGESRIAEVRALGRPRLLALTLLEIASAHGSRREFDVAGEQLREASAAAVLAGADLVAAEVATEALFVDGYLHGSRELGEHWAGLALAWLERAGSPSDLVRKLLSIRGMARRAADRFDDAVADQTAALAMLDRDAPESAIERAGMLAAIGETYRRMGRGDQAAEAALGAVTSYAASVGEQHPSYANAWNLLGSIQMDRGDFAAAEVSFLRAIEVGERAFGSGSGRLVDARANLGAVYTMTGRVTESITVKARALADLRAAGTPPSDVTVALVANLALSHAMAGDGERARTLQAEAIELAREVAGTESLLYAQQLVSAAELRLEQDPQRALDEATEGLAIMVARLEPGAIQRINAVATHAMAVAAVGPCSDAIPLLEQALADFAAHVPTDHPASIGALVALGRCNVGRARWKDAIDGLDRAARLNAAAGQPPSPEIVEWLARAHLGAGDRVRATTLHDELVALAGSDAALRTRAGDLALALGEKP